MKDLNELIYQMRFERSDSDTVADAVEHLRDYKDLLEITQKLRTDFDYLVKRFHNPPLQWEELKEMIGKPVFVHDWHYGGCLWHIIKDFEDIDGEEWIVFTDLSRFPKRELFELSTIHRNEVINNWK